MSYAVRNIVAILSIIIAIVALSMSSVNTVHASTMNGTYKLSWTWTGQITLANGTVVDYAKDATVYLGVFSGSSTGAEKDYEHPDGSGTFAVVENFTGSFNASKPGVITFHDEGYYEGYGEPNHWVSSFSGGSSGLTGLQGVVVAQSPGGACNSAGTFCAFQGTYTVTSATWGDPEPIPEFSTFALPLILGFAFSICFTLRRKKTNRH